MAPRRASSSLPATLRTVLVALMLLPLLLPTGSAQDAGECDIVASARVPQTASRDGTPLVVAVEFTECARLLHHEVRGWLGNATHQASRIHDGESWTTSQHYTSIEGLARQDGSVLMPLQANPKSAHADPLLHETSTTQAWLRLRGENSTTQAIALGPINWVDEDRVVPYWAAPAPALFVEKNDDLLGSGVQGVDKDGHPLPPGFTWIALPEDAPASPPPPVSPGDLLIVRMIPDLHEGSSLIELIVGEGIDDLQGLRLVSRAGTIAIPALSLSPGALVRVTDRPQALVAALEDQVPDQQFPDPSLVLWGAEEGEEKEGAAVAATVSGRFQFAKSGGFLQVEHGDVVLDSFAYGDTDPPAHWQGAPIEATKMERRAYLRSYQSGTFVDTDTALDWQRPRIHRQHQSDLETRWFTVEGPVRAFVCPDRCHEEALMRIDQAQATVDANLYELTLPSVVQALKDAQDRGVEVRVLLHDRPVGASTFRMDRVAWAVDELLASGTEVRTLEGTRYDVNHAKYLVVDNVWTFVTTENAVSSGWPADGSSGNRGHGVAVHDAGLASWTTTLFEQDYLHPVDAMPVTGTDLHEDRQPYHPPTGSLRPPPPVADRIETLVIEGPVPVAPVLAPDHLGDPVRNPIAQTLGQAQEAIGLAQLNLPLHWSRAGYTQDSPLADALVLAAEQGVEVTGTLADAFIDDPGRDGNHRTAAALHLAQERIDLRLAGGPGGEGIVHAKTWWTDPESPDGVAITGSANGNLASQALNRELTLILAHPQIAAYWAALGVEDHAQGTHFSTYAPDPRDERDDVTTAAPAPVHLALFVIAAIARVLAGARKSPPPDPL